MLILAIDTSTRTGSAAILRDSEVLAEVSGYEETPYSARIFRDISLLQGLANCRMDQIDVFAVAAGPGSFTGLRVGLTAVKAWAEVHRKPIAAISGLEAIAAEALTNGARNDSGAQYMAPFLDARRGQLFGAIYRGIPGDQMGLAVASDESVLSLEEFLELVIAKSPELVQLVSPTPDLIPSCLLAKVLPEARIVHVSAALAPAIGRLGCERAKRGDLVDSLTLDANYVRRSDAESKWKDG
jgi:tRNA threonylcarbamoyladenosine biosynthesis protein TsaB